MDRETRIELVVSVASVLVMIGVMVAIGTTYGNAQGVLTEYGGMILAVSILFFVVFMSVVGYGLAYFLKDGEDGDDGNGNPA